MPNRNNGHTHQADPSPAVTPFSFVAPFVAPFVQANPFLRALVPPTPEAGEEQVELHTQVQNFLPTLELLSMDAAEVWKKQIDLAVAIVTMWGHAVEATKQRR